MTKAIIFDLDSCLAAADEVGEQLFAPAFAAIRAANDGSVPEEKLRAAFAECWRVAYDCRGTNDKHHELLKARRSSLRAVICVFSGTRGSQAPSSERWRGTPGDGLASNPRHSLSLKPTDYCGIHTSSELFVREHFLKLQVGKTARRDQC